MSAVRNTVVRAALAAAAGALVVGGGLLAAPVASAITLAEQDYLNDLSKGGIVGDADALVADGHTICSALQQGADPDELSNTYYENSGSISHAQADLAINAAIQDLCPGV